MRLLMPLILLSVVFLSGCVNQSIVKETQEQAIKPAIAEETYITPLQETAKSTKKTSYSGQLIAGDTTKYIRFNQADYDNALAGNKVIYLYFYATWCPICAAERPNIFAAFNEMDYPDAVGFEVHYNDNEVTPEDESIARKFGISYQHTTIILDKNGNEAFRSLSPISKETIKEKIASEL